MDDLLRFLFWLLLASLLFSTKVLAEEKDMVLEASGIHYPGGYDLHTVGEVRGQVSRLTRPEKGPVRFTLVSDRATYTVLASPAWYLERFPDKKFRRTGSHRPRFKIVGKRRKPVHHRPGNFGPFVGQVRFIARGGWNASLEGGEIGLGFFRGGRLFLRFPGRTRGRFWRRGPGEKVKGKRKKIRMPTFRKAIIWLIPGLFLLWLTTAQANWEREAGLRAGYESNLDRAISSPQGSGYASGYLSLNREPDGDSRLDWSLWSQVEGTAYLNLPDLNGAVITLAPGLTYIPRKDWLVTIAPFVQAKSVVDSEQSALAWGGRLNLRQRWGEGVYTGQQYLYRDSRAQVDTYSYNENTLGLFLGLKWTANSFVEIGYEFSRGDSFLTVDHQRPSSTAVGPSGGTGRGGVKRSGQEKGPRYSSAFGSQVVKENVTRQALGMTLGIDWNKSIYSLAGYTYTNLQGESGTAINHAVFISTGCRF